jgi:hypothetical protein
MKRLTPRARKMPAPLLADDGHALTQWRLRIMTMRAADVVGMVADDAYVLAQRDHRIASDSVPRDRTAFSSVGSPLIAVDFDDGKLTGVVA